MRKITIISDINEKLVKKVFKRLDEFLDESTTEPIEIDLCSLGGNAYDGLALYSRLRSCPAPIIVNAYGVVMSAATIIFAAGDVRNAAEDCWFMFHDSADKVSGPVGAIIAKAAQLGAEEDQWAAILEQSSKTPKETWRMLSKRTSFLTAAEVLQLGLADNIMKGKPRP